MAMPNRNNGGAIAKVRLSDVSIEIRRRYGRLLLDRAIKELDPITALTFASELHAAVETPSDRAYWVPVEALERVMTPRRPRLKRR